MRTMILAVAGSLALAASAQAAPLASKSATIEFSAPPPFELVRDGCGRGWHRTHWRDQWGNWQWGHCISNGGPHDAWSRLGTIATQIGAWHRLGGAGVINSQVTAEFWSV
jgi:hypothetical protein